MTGLNRLSRLMNYLAAAIAGFGLVACNNPAAQQAAPVYYDVAGYVDGQIAALTQTRPTVSKRIRIGAQTQQLTTRTLNWSRELELFKQADINKPALRQSYSINRPDSLTYLYTLKPTEKNLAVRRLLVRLDSTTRQPRRIEATLTSQNPLYTTERNILLESRPQPGQQWAIQHYRIQGFQRLVIADQMAFDVEGNVQ